MLTWLLISSVCLVFGLMTLALPCSTLGKLLIAWFGRIWYSNAKLSAAHCATSAFTLWFANFISRMKNMTTLALIFLSQAYSLFAPKPLGQKMSKPLGLNFQTPWIKFPNLWISFASLLDFLSKPCGFIPNPLKLVSRPFGFHFQTLWNLSPNPSTFLTKPFGPCFQTLWFWVPNLLERISIPLGSTSKPLRINCQTSWIKFPNLSE